MKTLKEIAESILTRPLKKEDGLTFSEIEEIETDLGIKLPNILREFYSLVGGLDMLFINSFECFIKPYIKNGMLVFLEENEGLCYWGVKMQKLSNSQLNVYMCTDVEQNNTEWVSEEVTLDGFLSMLLYYQAASGGYEYSGAISETE
ncbi:MAG: SMI1/KNR4 family protein, partial [Prevotellaceae bacterium]|nr:SMI1/KNR4 family protein [Prevotellaceae bacterium]